MQVKLSDHSSSHAFIKNYKIALTVCLRQFKREAVLPVTCYPVSNSNVQTLKRVKHRLPLLFIR